MVLPKTPSARIVLSAVPAHDLNGADLVPKLRRRRTVEQPSSRRWEPSATAMAIGAGRVAIGAAFAAAPEFGVRLLGTDTATARRVAWLSRMVAGRDMALGAGTLAGTRRGSGAAWVAAGAFADAVDTAAVVVAMRQGRLRGAGAWLVAVGGPALTVVGLVEAARLRRRA